jgi:hypothetical protein
MPSLLELQDLYNEALVRELIEKTKSCALSWVHLGGTQFKATYVDESASPTITWDFFITKTTIGNTAAKWTLDLKKNAVAYVSIEAGPLPRTGRDSVVQELYEIIEMIVLELDAKLKEAIQVVQGLEGCNS